MKEFAADAFACAQTLQGKHPLISVILQISDKRTQRRGTKDGASFQSKKSLDCVMSTNHKNVLWGEIVFRKTERVEIKPVPDSKKSLVFRIQITSATEQLNKSPCFPALCVYLNPQLVYCKIDGQRASVTSNHPLLHKAPPKFFLIQFVLFKGLCAHFLNMRLAKALAESIVESRY